MTVIVESEGWPYRLIAELWYIGGYSNSADGMEAIYVLGVSF